MHITLVFPYQLFKQHPAVKDGRAVYILEESLFFKQYNFNKKKLVLHRASMKFYADYLRGKGTEVSYIDANDTNADIRQLIPYLNKQEVTTVHYAALADDWLERRLKKACQLLGIKLTEYRSPNFLNIAEEVSDFFDKRKTYFQTDFYTWQRKQRDILLEPDGKPIGGKWTFDTENRLKFPKNETVPVLRTPADNNYIEDAKTWVDRHFADNYGNTSSPFGKPGGFYPVTFDEADAWLDNFLKQRFQNFGIYEDSMVAEESFLYHSVLTPMLNIGLLNPQQIIDKALEAATEYDVPMNSLEGFIRQIMGWREFIHIVYEREGRRQRTKNYWGFKRKIPQTFWTGETGIGPVDIVIKKVLDTGYNHHIERLMVMGNFLLLCEFDPDEVYRWFMEMYIDAYDWVMVPNVYGMTQFADGGLMVTKPYISGSNYLLKMGDWQKGPWQEIWDGLFWRFMNVHRSFFLQNPRLGMLVKTFDNMADEKRAKYLANAERFLEDLDKS